MKKNFLFYLSFIFFLSMHKGSFSMNAIELQGILSNIVEDNNFSNLEELLKEIPEELEEFSSPEEAQQKINTIFIEPINKAINSHNYNLAYYLIQKTKIIANVDGHHVVLQPDLLFKDSAGISILRCILNAKDSLLLTLVYFWIAEKVTQFISEELEKEESETPEELAQDTNSFETFIKAIQGDGITLDELKNIIYQVLLITNSRENQILLTIFKDLGIDLQEYDQAMKLRANYLLFQAIKLSPEKLKEYITIALNKGADINSRNIKNENTILILALKRNLPTEIIHFLIENKADVNGWGAAKQTPLMVASMQGNVPSIKKLIEYGAHINAQDALDQTALMLLIQDIWKGRLNLEEKLEASNSTIENIIEELMSHGANPSIKDVFGQNPLDYAKEINDPEIITLLQQALPKVKQLSIQEQIQTLENVTNKLNALATLAK